MISSRSLDFTPSKHSTMLATSSYERTKVIGQGKFGVVYKGYHKKTEKVVAIKVLDLDTKYDEVVDVQQEIQFLADLKNCPNVTHYYGSFLDDTKLWIIMDYCAGGSLRTLLKAGTLEEKHIGVIAREVLMALQAVHKMGVIHRDLKAANILITNDGQVQVCDFGVAAQLTANSNKRTTIAGTPFWMAPEVIREGDNYNVKADIWSLGITLYELATGNPPYSEKGASWAMAMIEKQAPPRLEGREYPSALKECIALCLDENPDERPSADDLMKCKLVKLYKNLPTAVLKEVISRYLLWRDRNSSRDSVYVHPDDASKLNQPGLEVKWDFDSLSSKEYIVENDIDLEVAENYDHSKDNDYTLNAETFHHNVSTFRLNETLTNSNLALASSSTQKLGTGDERGLPFQFNSSTQATSKTGSHSAKNATSPAPKSLISLFEEEDDGDEHMAGHGSSFEIPRGPNISLADSLHVSSPTIEIPDMESLSKLASATRKQSLSVPPTKAQSSHNSPQHNFPSLDKPPALVLTLSNGSNAEPRVGSPTNGNKSRKHALSNTGSSFSSGASFLDQSVPRTPPYVQEHTNQHQEKGSPTPVLNGSNIVNSEMSLNNSPSKSMRALYSNNNPMLQPINFKLHSENSAVKHANGSTTSLHANSGSLSALTGTGSGASTSGSNIDAQKSVKTKKEKPSLRIQMPVPSASFNPLAALTGDVNDSKRQDSNVNQFGINPSLVGSVTSMTPVAEKENQLNDSVEHKPRMPDLNGAAARSNSQKRIVTTPGPASAPITGSFGTSEIPLSRNQSFSKSSIRKNLRFPIIPPLDGDLFMDSTPKAKIASELENLVLLFKHGLDALEESF